MCRRTRQIIAFAIGDRSEKTCRRLWKRVPENYCGCVSYSDFWEALQKVLLEKTHHPVGKNSGQTHHMERWYCTLRQHQARYARKTLSFSKKDAFHHMVTKWYIVDHNLAIKQSASLTSWPSPYVVWKDRKAFIADLKTIYQAATREEAEANLQKQVRCRGAFLANNWDDLSTLFEFPKEIRRLIYTMNTVEDYHRQLRKVTKNKGSFPTEQVVRKLLYQATMDITKKWTTLICDWPLILNQLAIRFEERWPI